MLAGILLAWTVAAAAWWASAAWLVRQPRPVPQSDSTTSTQLITVFRPVPSPLGADEVGVFRDALLSLLGACDAQCEVLLGANTADADTVRTIAREVKAACPGTPVEVVVDDPADDGLHPKVRWNRVLAKRAGGELWLWTDADIEFPPRAIETLRKDLGALPGMVTSPYTVTRCERAADLLDALYVNVEFYPGLILLGRRKALRGALGAAMLFQRGDFLEKTSFEELSTYLADDFELGRRLAPVRLASVTLTTRATNRDITAALLHYLRWQKTVRWVQPGGFAAQLAVMPVLGWLAFVALAPGAATGWAGLALTVLIDAVAARRLCHLAGCSLRANFLPGIAAWSVLRGLVWIACWLPWPVVWRGRRLWSPRFASRQVTQPVAGGAAD